MSDIVSSWSPGQAMLPPDPDGHNRMLDRVAAEHLRAVAPGLAPCLSCQAGLCAEHGPVRVETTTSGLTCRNCGGAGRYEGVTDPRDGTVEWLACPCTAPAPPQPEPAKANAPRKGSKAWAIQEACRIVGIAFHGIAEYDEACDCFCSESPHEDYRNGGHALAFVEAAVREKLAREKAPAPPSEAKGEQPCACAGHREPGDPLICRKRYSEMLEAIYEDDYGDTAELRDALLRHDRALRERAREAEERAERYAALVVELRRERDEAREQRDAAQGLLSEALCNLGTARGDLATERAARLRAEAERDGALTEANDLRLRVERLVEGAAKLTERAEEAEEELRLADFRVKSAESRSDDFAARLAAAEAEVKRRDDVVDEHASDSARAGLERDRAEHRLKLATEEIVRVRLAYDDPSLDGTDGAHPAWWRGSDAGVAGAVRIVNEALDEPLPLAGCVGGANLERVRQRIAALRERAERLVEAGDVLRNLARRFRSTVYGPEEIDRAIAEWAAAKGTK